MSVFSSIKNWFKKTFGGGSKSSGGSKRSGGSKSSAKRASRVTNYGGGGSRSYSDYSGGRYKADYEDRQERERRERQERERKRQATTDALASISKRTDALSSGRSSSAASSATHANAGNGTARVLAKIGEKAKATPPDPKIAQAKKSRDDTTKALESLSKGMRVKSPEEMVKSGDYEYRPKAKNMNTPSADSRSTTRQSLQGYKKQMSGGASRVTESFARGFGGDATYGVVDTLMRGNKDDKTEREIEKYYQAHKSKAAENAGRLVGSLLSFGMSEKAAVNVMKDVAPEFLKRGGGKAVEHLAKNPAFRKAAQKEAEKAGMKITDEVVERFALQRAKRVVDSIGADMAVNWTTGGLMDVNQSVRDTLDENNGKLNAKDLAKNFAVNRAMNYGLGGAVTVVPALRTQKGFLKDGLLGTNFLKKDARDDALDLARRIGAENALGRKSRGLKAGAIDPLSAPRIGESIDDTISRRATQTAEQNAADRVRQAEAAATERTRQAEAADMRRNFLNRANEADQAMNSGFTLRDFDAKPSALDPNTPSVNIGRLADATNAARDANRRQTLEGLLSNARANETPGRRIDLGDLVNIRNADDAAKQTRLNEINAELESIQNEIRLKRLSASAEELDALNGRFDELLAERRALETPPTLEQRRSALQAERDDLAEQYRLASQDDSVSPLELQQTLDDMQELDLEIRDLDAQMARESRGNAPNAPEVTAAPEPTVNAPARQMPPAARNAGTEAPNINEGNLKAEAPQVRAEAPQTKAELPGANAEAPKTEVPKTKEEAIRMAREAQTQKESESLLRAYFEENGEVDLGVYGQVTKNADGTYKISIDGAGEKNLTKAEVEKRIKDSTKRAYTEQDVIDSVEDVVHKRKERASFRERLKKAARSGRTLIADSLASFEDMERALAKSEHRQVDYGAINETRAYQAKANRSISNNQLDFHGDKYGGTVKRRGADGVIYEIENGKSLADIFKGMDEETEIAFDAYLNLRHAPARLLQGKPVFDNKVLKGVGDLNDPNVCIEEANRLLREHPEFARKAEEVYQYTQNELRNRVKAGLLKQSTVDAWNEMYPYYVPTGREGFNEIHGISGSIVGAEDIKGAKGSGRNINSIRDQLEASTTRNWRDISTNELFRRYFGDRIANDLAKDADGGVERVLNNTINLGKSESSGKYFAEIFINGSKHKVEIEDKFYDALADLYKNGRTGVDLVDTTNEAFSKVAGIWKNLITEWSPIFMVKNGMRDFPEAIINSRQTKEFLACMGPARRDLANGGPFSEALRDAGISQSTFIDLDKAIREGKDKKSWLARANEMVEMYPRLCEYMATLKKAGIDINDPDALKKASRELRARAAANAADVTVNFGRSGSVGKMLNKGLVPFFNPSIQGWSKFVRNVTERDFKSADGLKDALSFFIKASALGAGATTANNFLLQDNPNYQQISARDKATNYIIPWPPTSKDTDIFIKIPASRFAAAYSLPAVNLMNENKMGFAEMIKVMNDQVAPIDPLESTLLSPFVTAAANKTWYGSPIVPGALEDLPKPEQYDQNTSLLAKALGKATENLPEPLQISPKKADYILDAETGVAGDFILPALTPSRQGGGEGLLNKVGPAVLNVPKRAFTIDSTTQNDLSSRFYKDLKSADTKNKSAKATEKDAAEYKRLSEYSTEISGITKAITELQASDKATKQADINGLQKVRNQLMQDALDGKAAPTTAKKLDAVQKYVGTTYAINNFGSSADKEAMKVYGASVYGNLSDADMAKKIDADKDFYTGVRAIGNLEDTLSKEGLGRSTTLTKAVALASVNASDELFGAYQGTKKGRNETATKMERARNYLADGGSTEEFVKLEKARKTLGKLSTYDKDAELDRINDQLAKGEITSAEYYQKQGEIKYNANISYVGLATSLAQANAPGRGYVLYDIKGKNIRKGINLAAMGFSARDYREMAKAVDSNGNGYPSKQEIVDYVASSDVEDKATLFDALYYYPRGRNPFGTAHSYTRAQAAEAGRRAGIEAISGDTKDFKITDESKSGYYGRRYGRRGWHRWHRHGHSKKATVPAPKTIKAKDLVQGQALVSKKKNGTNSTNTNPTLKRVEAKIDLPTPKKR